MKTLYICRHAKTNNYSADGSDHSRELTAIGMQNARDLGIMLADYKTWPELMLASDAQRASNTAQLIKNSLPSVELEFTSQLYASTADDVIALLQPRHESSIMIVGHNPCLEELAHLLTGETQHLRPCHCLRLDLELDNWNELGPKVKIAKTILLSTLSDD